MLQLNPEALEIAQALDEERSAGNVRGAMHGITVLLKDNNATVDDLHTAVGAAVMLDWDPDWDTFLASRLRDAGAVILGEANLSACSFTGSFNKEDTANSAPYRQNHLEAS